MASSPPVWFITAASSGFGKAIALEALARGHRVIASARSTSRITELAEAGAETVALDVTSPLSNIERVAKEANEKYGYINHLVNAAGYILVGAVEETTPEEDYNVFATNVFGLLNVCKAFVPYLRLTVSSSSAQHCTVANFGSLGSWRGGAGYALYAGTKWACSGISESLRFELDPLGIHVTVIEPGYFRTGFLNAGAQVTSQKRIDAYDESAVGTVRKALDTANNNQPGDVVKGAKVIVDVLMKEGAAAKRDVPLRVVLGQDSVDVVRGKCEETVRLLDEWHGITDQTDHVA